MITINYAPRFSREFFKLNRAVQKDALDAIILFRDYKNHESLSVHKLHGRLKNRYSFSVNYEYRIVCRFVSKREVDLLAIGDHDIYKK